MSVQAISWVIEKSVHKASPFVLLLILANHAHSDGTGAYPSVETLAREARISERHVFRLVRKLCKSGELRVEKYGSPYGTNLYSLPLMTNAVPQMSHTDKLSPDKRGPQMSPEPSLTVNNKRTELKTRYCSVCGRTGSWHLNAKRRGELDHEFSEAA